jgi:hypothetical protein
MEAVGATLSKHSERGVAWARPPSEESASAVKVTQPGGRAVVLKETAPLGPLIVPIAVPSAKTAMLVMGALSEAISGILTVPRCVVPGGGPRK